MAAGGSDLVLLHAPDVGVSLSTSIIGSSFKHSKAATWNTTKILNRSSGVVNFSSSENETVSFSIGLYAYEDATSEVADAVKALRSLVFPIAPGTKPPSVCYLTYGGIFDSWRCVVSNVSVSYPHDIWDDAGVPMSAEVSISLLEVDIENMSASSIGSGDVFSPSWV